MSKKLKIALATVGAAVALAGGGLLAAGTASAEVCAYDDAFGLVCQGVPEQVPQGTFDGASTAGR